VRRRAFAVIGLGRFGAAMATTLVELGQDVLGIDADADKVRRLSDLVPHVVELDATDERALRAAGVQDVDVAIISIGAHVEASLLAVMLVKDLGVKTVVAKAATGLHGRILEKIGVSRVVFAERDMAIRVAHSLVVPNVIDYFELSRDFSIVELPAPKAAVGRRVVDLQLSARYGLTLIALKRRTPGTDRETTKVVAGADDRVEDGDVLVLLGSNERLARLDDFLTDER
jgi:trk system potassium uptake protein TrkA